MRTCALPTGLMTVAPTRLTSEHHLQDPQDLGREQWKGLTNLD
jgi:hypothetical protein